MKAHFPSILPPKQVTYSNKFICTSEINGTQINGFDRDAVIEVIQSFKSKKAAGPDGLKPFVLKELSNNQINELLFIYKSMILMECTPTQWTQSKVIWIPVRRASPE